MLANLDVTSYSLANLCSLKTIVATYEKLYHELFATISQVVETFISHKESIFEALTVLRESIKVKVYKYQMRFIIEFNNIPDSIEMLLFNVSQTEECIKKRYKELSLCFHPDKI